MSIKYQAGDQYWGNLAGQVFGITQHWSITFFLVTARQKKKII